MKILLATDGSDSAKMAVDFLLRFPFPEGSSVTVLTVIDTNVLADRKFHGLDEDQTRLLHETRETLHREAEKLIASESARLREAGWTGTTELRNGNPAEEIIQAGEDLQPDLIVLGSHGTEGMTHFLIGSVSDRVLTHAGCSVLVVKPSPTLSAQADTPDAESPWRILIAHDDSEPANRAINFCASLPLDDSAKINVISVMPMIHMYRQDIRQQLNTIWQQQKHFRKEALETAVSAIQWSTPHVSSNLVESTDVAQAILEHAAQDASDLVVLGYKGRSAIKRFLLGSITSRIAHHSPCSILAVRT